MPNTYTVICRTPEEWDKGIDGTYLMLQANSEEHARELAAGKVAEDNEYFTTVSYQRPDGIYHHLKYQVTERIDGNLEKTLIDRTYVSVPRPKRRNKDYMKDALGMDTGMDNGEVT